MITIEKIGGVKHTVLWHDENVSGINQAHRLFENLNWQTFALGQKALLGHRITHKGMSGFNSAIAIFENIATALPPLPRHPTKDDAGLLHLYAAHGLFPRAKAIIGFGECEDAAFALSEGHFTLTDRHSSSEWCSEHGCEITHAVTADVERVEIAIKD